MHDGLMSTALATQAPGFARTRLGCLTVTSIYDGALPIFSHDMHGESADAIAGLLAEDFLPPEGDMLTAVNTFLFEAGGRLVLVDAGAGTSLGPGTGHLVDNLSAAGVAAAEIDDVLITHLHPDHVFGLLTPAGEPTFPNATVHIAQPDATYWLDPGVASRAEGVQAQIHQWASEALAPYQEAGRFEPFSYGETVCEGVVAVDLHGHTPGHSGYLLDAEDAQVLFWGDTMHSHSVQLRAPHVTMDIDSDGPTARASRVRILADIRDGGWTVAGAHLPFPGIGRIRFGDKDMSWVPAPYRPIESDDAG